MALLKTGLVFCCLLVGAIRHNCVAESQQDGRKTGTQPDTDTDVPHAFVVIGASGDLAKREIYPALWALFRDGKLPSKTRFYGLGRPDRPDIDMGELRLRVVPFVKVALNEFQLYDQFWALNTYIRISNDMNYDFDQLNEIISKDQGGLQARGNRIFYLAIPPSQFQRASTQIKRACMAKKGWTRLAVEKPHGHDLASSDELSQHLSSLFTENQIYLMDHFLAYDMVQNLLRFRFANRLFGPSWNKENIASVKIDFRENMGIEGRGIFFSENGIIRDVMQNHLLQIMSLIAMERPNSTTSDDVREAKVKLMKDTKPVEMEDVVLGQYVGNPDSDDLRERIGYLDDPTVPPGSNASTFALTVLKIENERWSGVPFIIRAGKGLNVDRTEVIVQYKDIENDIFDGQSHRNELIMRIGRSQALQAKIMSKKPGFSMDLEEIKMEFDYQDTYKNLQVPSAYEVLLWDIFRGYQTNFVEENEVREAWRIFTPILHEIEKKKIKPIQYRFGSNGPAEADELEKNNNFL